MPRCRGTCFSTGEIPLDLIGAGRPVEMPRIMEGHPVIQLPAAYRITPDLPLYGNDYDRGDFAP
jgi:hypothetical protein